jgi:hypothetical protein
MVMMMAAGFVPCIGGLVQIAIVGPLVAAWYGYFLKYIRGQPALLEDVFAVFSSPDLLQLIIVYVIIAVLGVLMIVPIPVAVFATVFWTAAQPDAPTFVVVPVLAILGSRWWRRGSTSTPPTCSPCRSSTIAATSSGRRCG